MLWKGDPHKALSKSHGNFKTRVRGLSLKKEEARERRERKPGRSLGTMNFMITFAGVCVCVCIERREVVSSLVKARNKIRLCRPERAIIEDNFICFSSSLSSAWCGCCFRMHRLNPPIGPFPLSGLQEDCWTT